MAITVDATLSTSSTNPVQNKAITLELNNKADSSSLPHGVPSGGTTGQVLVKSSNSDYAVEWQTVTVPSGTKNISISSNGTTTENVTNYASAQITTNVPNTYSASDEGKVVSNGALVSQTSDTVTVNDTYDTTLINSLTVNVSGGGTDDFFDYSKPTGTIVSDVASLPQYAIANRTGITSIELTNSSFTIGTNYFRECTNVQSIKTVGKISGSMQGSFYGCSALQGIVLVHPDNYDRTIYNEVFRGCSSLAYIDTNANGSGQTNVFYGCASLNILVLRKNGVFSLGNTNHFTGTPFASGGTGGTIYVPSAQIDNYKAATNWSTINGYGTITWEAIEGSYYETHYADGTLIPT